MDDRVIMSGTEDRPVRKKALRLAIVLVILILAAAVFVFTRSPIYPAVKSLYTLWRDPLNQFEPVSASLYYEQIDENLILNAIGARMNGDSQVSVFPCFLKKEGNTWTTNIFEIECSGLFSEYETRFIPGESFITEFGEYTIIGIGSAYLEKHELTVDDVYDSCRTNPVLLSCEGIEKAGNDVTWGYWARITLGGDDQDYSMTMTSSLKKYEYFFAVKELPDDYQLHVGDVTISAQDIREKK